MDAKLPNNENLQISRVSTEDDILRDAFESPRDDADSYLAAYFTVPYERPARKRSAASASRPDGRTLSDLVEGLRRK